MENTSRLTENKGEKIEFQQAGSQSLPELVNLNSEIFKGMYPWPGYDLDIYNTRLANKNPVIFLAKENGKVIGDSISYEESNSLYVWILGVIKEYRGKGVGSHLYELNEEYAKEKEYKSVNMKIYTISQEMIKVAESRGYKKIKVVKNEENPLYDANIFELNLTSL